MEPYFQLLRDGVVIGTYPTEDAAMCAAQDQGMLRPAHEDEGGQPYAVLPAPHEIKRIPALT